MTFGRRFCRGTILALLVLPLLQACGKPMETSDVKLNPTPRMRYEITMEVANAPGPFDRVDGGVYFRAGDDCVPLTPFSGARLTPDWHEAVTFQNVRAGTYRAYIYADRLVDEDYFGLGACHWRLESVDAELVIGPVTMSPGITSKDIFGGIRVGRYFAKESYTDRTMERVDNGADSPGHYKHPDDTFTVTLSAIRVLP